MAVVKFYKDIEDEKLSFAVIVVKMGGKWVLCKHKDRTTFEFPGGHRKAGESILETARRELREETGAGMFSLEHICDYSVQGFMRYGEQFDKEVFGALFYAKITFRKENLHSEIEEVVLLDSLPDNWTYPLIMPELIEKAQRYIRQNEKGTAYFLVHDENLEKHSQGGDPFIKWLFSEGFNVHETYRGGWRTVTGVWINLNTKIIAFGMPGIRCFEEIGHHALTIDEFKIIYAIYKKYEGKAPFEFD